MVDGFEFLLVISEVAVALIAFTTIVVVLRQLMGNGLSAFQIVVVRLFALCGFSALFMSLLPILLSFLGVDQSLLWRICNAAMLVLLVCIQVWYFRRRKEVAPNRPINISNIINFATTILGSVLLVLGITGIAYQNSVAPFAFCLVGLLLAAATAFLGTLGSFLEQD